MSDANLSPSAFVAKAVEQFCLPMAHGGEPPKQTDASWRWLTDDERRDKCGLTEPGRTAAYRLKSNQLVFMDMTSRRVMLWFQSIDARNSVAVLEAALSRAAPAIAQIEDVERAQSDGMRTRTYLASFGSGRHAHIEAAYTATLEPPAASDRFKVIVQALTEKPGVDADASRSVVEKGKNSGKGKKGLN